MGELTAIGFVPGRSFLHRLDPRTKQALLMILSAVSMGGAFSFVSLLSVILFGCFHAAGVSLVRLVREIRYFLIFLIFVFAVRTFRFESGWIFVFDSDLAGEALMICWRLLLVVLMGLLVMVSTRTAHIRAALIWFLRPIPFIHEKMAATMVGLIVRFLPQILFQAADISDAQCARCIERRRNPLVRLKCFAIALFRRTFLSADELVVAMQARCYNENRTLPDFSFSRRDVIAVVSAFLISLASFLPWLQ